MLRLLPKKIFIFFWLVAAAAPSSCFCVKPHVLVSVEPYIFLVKRIAEDTVTVDSLVPRAADLHTYEPTPHKMMQAARADLWFAIGEIFEQRASRALLAANPHMRIVDLRKGLDLIQNTHGCSHGCPHGHGEDLHLWLSAPLLKQQARNVAEALKKRYPQHAQAYERNLHRHLQELDALDADLSSLLSPMKGRFILVGHPAYGYLFRDYGLHQLPIEQEGKDPTGVAQTKLLQKAKESQIKAVYTQAQFNPKAPRLLAKQLDVPVITLDPFQQDYLYNLREIAKQIATAQGRD